MTTISDFLIPDHHFCDGLFATTEAEVAKGDWGSAFAGFSHFHKSMKHHFAMEEEVMFPAFENRTGITQGPTSMMRNEHCQMTDLLSQLADAVEGKDRKSFLGDADTLLILIQQHNLKEEQMLYRMADQVFEGQLDEVVGRMRAMA